MGSQGVMLRERGGRERDGVNNEWGGGGCNGFLGKTSFQWSINTDSVTRRLKENTQQHIKVTRGH